MCFQPISFGNLIKVLKLCIRKRHVVSQSDCAKIVSLNYSGVVEIPEAPDARYEQRSKGIEATG